MTLHQLPPVEPTARTVEDRLGTIEAQIDVLISGVTALLDEVVAIRKRWETPHA